MADYNIKDKGISNTSENTSAISTISYEIENAIKNELSEKKIKKQLEILQKNDKFPPNLEIVDAFYDPKTSSSGVAFLDNNTGKVIVGFAGTNFDSGFWAEGRKDVSQWGNIASNGDGPTSSYFKASNKFMTDLKENGYNIETVTGHSLGGRNGTIMGMHHNVPNIILYNSAPLVNGVSGASLEGLSSIIFGKNLFRTGGKVKKVYDINKLIKGYKGNVIYFVSENDPLNKVAGVGGSVYPGKIMMIINGKAHDITGFLSKKEQQFIRDNTPNLNKLNQAISKAQKVTTKDLKTLEQLRLKLLKSGGGLTQSEEKYLDASEALVLTQGMHNTLEIEIKDITKMYSEAKKSASDLWDKTLKSAEGTGASLTYGEVLESLEAGGASESILKREPQAEYEQKISELSAIQQEYATLISDIQSAISKQLEMDQDLAKQVGG